MNFDTFKLKYLYFFSKQTIIDNLIKELPKEIIKKIIPYTYNIISDDLKRDITTFDFTFKKIKNLFLGMEEMITNQEHQNELKNQIKLDIIQMNRNFNESKITLEKIERFKIYENRVDHLNVIKTIILKWSRVNRLKFLMLYFK